VIENLICLIRIKTFEADHKTMAGMFYLFIRIKFLYFFCLMGIQITDLPTIITDWDMMSNYNTEPDM